MQAALALALAVLGTAGCSAPLSALDPAGPAAASVARAWWLMAAAAGVILMGVTLLAAYAVWRRSDPIDERRGRRVILVGGVVFPLAVLAALLAYGLTMGHGLLPHQEDGEVYRVDVTARQWQWDVAYPDAPASPRMSVNELHIPAGRPVDVHVTTADVIHSFWVPRLGGKIDALPGRTNVVRLRADRPGVFRGVCAEFCGTAHAAMFMQVHAHEDGELARRLASLPVQAGGSPPLTDGSQRGRRGEGGVVDPEALVEPESVPKEAGR